MMSIELSLYTILIAIMLIFGSMNYLKNNFLEVSQNDFEQSKEYIKLSKNIGTNTGNGSELNELYNGYLTHYLSTKGIGKKQEITSTNNINYMYSENHTSFVNLNIEELKGSFTLNFPVENGYRYSFLGIICKNTDKSNDTYFDSITNKISLVGIYDSSLDASVVDVTKEEYYGGSEIDNDCFYIQLSQNEINHSVLNGKNGLGKTIIFKAPSGLEHFSTTLFYEKLKIVNDGDTITNGTGGLFIDKDGNKYYEGGKWILKKDKDSTLKLENFFYINKKNVYGLGEEKSKILSFQTPLIFYVK